MGPASTEVEVAAQPMESALDAFMPVLVHRHHDLLNKQRGWRNVEPSVVLHHVVGEGPGCAVDTAGDPSERDEGQVCVLGVVKARDEVEARS